MSTDAERIENVALADIRRLTLGPHDALIVTVPDHLTGQEIHRICDQLHDALPNRAVIVTTQDFDYAVIGSSARRR